VVVLREGRTVAEFEHGADQDQIMQVMAHGESETARRLDGQTASNVVRDEI
jgi:ABC-type sugar transport system ATPase subunit